MTVPSPTSSDESPLSADALTETPADLPPELAAMPADELRALAEDFGVDISARSTPLHLAIAIHQRRQLIASLDHEALLEVIRWARRPVPADAPPEVLAQEILRCKSMRVDGLSPGGLIVLALLRDVKFNPEDSPERMIRKLKRQEGILAKFARKRRRWLGSMVSSMLGDEIDGESADYKFLPPESGEQTTPAKPPRPGRSSKSIDEAPGGSLKDQIEEAGLLGGLAGRIKRSADSYLKEKLDEIEARIDKKLDDIDGRLAEWRDKEVANRLRIIKITLWASLIVAGIALVISFVQTYILPHFR